MDIQINAAQGRGKSTLARAIANTQGGIIYEAAGFEGANISFTKIARDIVEARADVVIFDGCPKWDGWRLDNLKEAVQAARQSLRRNIVAIYCVQDRHASVNNSTRAFIPFGFVNAGAQPLEDAEPVRNTFKADPEQLRAEQLRAAGIAVKSVGTVKSYTSDILMDMARTIRAHGSQSDILELCDVYGRFGVSGIAVLPPVFFATAHELILPIYKRVKHGTK